MIQLENENLAVDLLDPVVDRERMGTRYCTGGYIFQVTDRGRGPLLSGPTYPDSFNTFDGQGIPDAFNQSPLRDPKNPGPLALIPGIGVCDLAANTVETFCDWQIDNRDDSVGFGTEQAFEGYAFVLTRTVSLHGRSVASETTIEHRGKGQLPIRWFPHPFFPQPETDELCRLDIPYSFGRTKGYAQAPSGFIQRTGWPWTEGHYVALDHAAHGPVTILQKHPVVGLVAGTTSYVPSLFPIWGNPNTFSWEPYFERTLAAGQSVTWSVVYDF